MKMQTFYDYVIDPRPNKVEEIKEEAILNEQEDNSKDEVNKEKVIEESFGEDKDGIKKETLNETNVDTDVVNGEEHLAIVNE